MPANLIDDIGLLGEPQGYPQGGAISSRPDPNIIDMEQIPNRSGLVDDIGLLEGRFEPMKNRSGLVDDIGILSKPEYRKEPETFLGRVKESWDIGQLQTELGQLRASQLYGDVSPETENRIKEIKSLMPKGKTRKRSLPEAAIRSAAEMLPIQIAGMKEGAKRGAVLGMGFGATAALAGQAGPQIATPEEIITVPAATAAGFSIGMTSGTLQNIGEIEGGLAYDELLDLKVDPSIAKAAATGVGVINGLIELAQIKLLLKGIPGADKILSSSIREAVKKAVTSKSLKRLALRAAGRYAGVITAETAQEVAQESTNIVADELGKSLTNRLKGTNLPHATKSEIVNRLVDTAKQSALAFSVMTLPGGISGTVRDVGQRTEVEPPPTPGPPVEQIRTIKKAISSDINKGNLPIENLMDLRENFQNVPDLTDWLDIQINKMRAKDEPIDLLNIVRKGPAVPVFGRTAEERAQTPQAAAGLREQLAVQQETEGLPGRPAIESARSFQDQGAYLLGEIRKAVANSSDAMENAVIQDAQVTGSRYGLDPAAVSQAIIDGITDKGGFTTEAYTRRAENAARLRENERQVFPREGGQLERQAPAGQYVESDTGQALRQRSGEGRENLEQRPPEQPGREGELTPREAVDVLASEAETEPTEAQKKAGNYKKAHLKLHGFDISIENPRGSIRSGTDKAGKPWETEMKSDYGYIRMTEGKDTDQVDVFIGPKPESKTVFVINQVDPDTSRFDEHKVLIGWNTEEEAQTGYLENYQKGWKGLGSIREMSMDQFKSWLKEGDQKKAVPEMKTEKPTARFEGYQDRSAIGKEPLPLFTIQGGEMDGSTVSRETLQEQGIEVPETPETESQPQPPTPEAKGKEDIVPVSKKEYEEPHRLIEKRINKKYADILAIEEEDFKGDIYDKIDDHELTPNEVDNYLSNIDNAEDRDLEVRRLKTVIADQIGELIETHKYESHKDGQDLENYLDSLLEATKSHEGREVVSSKKERPLRPGIKAEPAEGEELPRNRRERPAKEVIPALPTEAKPTPEAKGKEAWEMTADEAVEQNKKRIIESGVDESEIDENQIKLWKQTHIENIANSPRNTDISTKVLASLPETARESLLRTHPVAASNWIDSFKVWNKPYKKVLEDVQIRAGIGAVKKLHRNAVQRALSENKPVPREVLEDYKSEPWAQEALNKLKEAPTDQERMQEAEVKEKAPPAPAEAPTKPIKAEIETKAGEGEKVEPKKKPKLLDKYLNEKINYGGEIRSRGSVIAEMQKEGAPQKNIDAYMIGAKTIEQPPAEPAKAKPGRAYIKGKWVPFTEYHAFKRGKNKGKFRVRYQGRNHIIEAKSIKEFPVDPVKDAKTRIKDSLKDEKGSLSFKKIEGTPLYDDLLTVSKDILGRGHTSYRAFRTQMKQAFSDVWNNIRRIIRDLWNQAKRILSSERGTLAGEKAEGAPIATEEFKQKMKDSVVTKTGKPWAKPGDELEVYHGTATLKPFEEFEPDAVGSNTFASDTREGETYFFTDNPSFAGGIIDPNKAPRIIPVNLSFKNPYITKIPRAIPSEIAKEIRYAKNNGFDSVAISFTGNKKGGLETGNFYIAFSPDQIISAFPETNITKAEKLYAEGKPDAEVFKATGWMKGPEGKWRFRIDDSGAFLLPEYFDLKKSEFGENKERLEKVFSHRKLFKAYPDLKDIKVIKQQPIIEGNQAWYDSEKNETNISPRAKDIKAELLHEIQHIIQGIEGFARGGSLAFGLNEEGKAILKKRSDPINKKLEIARKNNDTKEVDRLKQELYELPIQAEFDTYRLQAGEISAREAGAGFQGTPFTMEGIPRSEWIVRDGKGTSFSVEPPKDAFDAEKYIRDIIERSKKPDISGSSGNRNNNDRAKEALHKNFNSFMYWVVDKNRPISSIQSRLDKVTEDIDLFLRETQRPKITTNRVKEAWENEIMPFLKRMAKYNIGIGEFEQYAHARHAREANEALRLSNSKRYFDSGKDLLNAEQKRTLTDTIKKEMDLIAIGAIKRPEAYRQALNILFRDFSNVENIDALKKRWNAFSDKPSGMTDKEADRILKSYKGDKNIEKLRLMLLAINNNRLDILNDAGLLANEEYAAIRKKYKYYVPLYREGFEDQAFGSGRGLQPAGRPIKVRGGSTREVVNIIANTVSNYENAINRAEKAESAKTLFNLVKANPNPDFWSIKEVKKSPHYDAYGNLRMYPDLFNVAPNEMRVMIDGKQHIIEVNKYDKDAMLMMRTLKAEDAMGGPILSTLSKINQWLARINTSWSPEFIVSNFARDIQTAGININDTGVESKKIFRGALESIKTIYNVEREAPEGTELEALYGRFKKAGGKIGWPDVHGTVEKLAGKITKELEILEGKRPARKTAREWLKWVEDANTAVENGVRLHVFSLAVGQGMSDKKAAQIASDITVDFTKKGAAGPVINSLYLFANAGIQGSYRIIRAGVKSGKVRKMMGGIVGAGFLVGLLNAALGGKDDDDEDYFNKIDDFVRERNMIIMIPGTKGKYFKIPLPWGYNFFWNLGTEVSRTITKENYSPLRGIARMGSTFANAFNPIASGTLLQTLSPTIVDPFAMAAENKKWFGGDLMPTQNKFEKVPTPDSQRYWKSASEPSKWVAGALNRLTGGNKIRKGLIDVSPETLDLIVDSAGGSMLRFFQDVFDIPIKKIRGEKVKLYKIPFIRRVFGEKSEWSDSRIYRENLTQVLTLRNELKAYQGTDYYNPLKKKSGAMSDLITDAINAERRISRLKKRKNRYEAARNKKEAERMDDSIMAIKVEFNKKFNKVAKQ